ncbi:hypothetical protein Trydic_g9798 [Trypoxylus dichotomus]
MRFIFKIILVLQCYSNVRNSVLIETHANDFPVYWNIPSFQCRPHKIFFTDIAKKFNIIQNQNDSFRGEKISILYDPGDFPAILEDVQTKKLTPRNGGVPQEGNITLHFLLFEEAVNQLIPDKNFNGIGIIDFESWRPVFRQNWGSLSPYQDLSVEVEKKRHPTWSKKNLTNEARKRFELYARDFMQETLYLAKELRPAAKWGYYAYPYCFNMAPNNMESDCSQQIMQENDRIKWLFTTSTVYYPSLYFSQSMLTSEKKIIQMVQGRLKESQRIISTLPKVLTKPKVLPYIWLKYRDTNEYMTKEDLSTIFMVLKSMHADGVIIWGSSKDVNSRKKCQQLYDYVENVLGPILLGY